MLKCRKFTMTCNTYWKNCGCSFHCPSSLRCQFADYLIGILLRMTAFWDHLGSARGISLYNLETLIEWNYMMDFSLIIAALSQWDPFENRCHLKKYDPQCPVVLDLWNYLWFEYLILWTWWMCLQSASFANHSWCHSIIPMPCEQLQQNP